MLPWHVIVPWHVFPTHVGDCVQVTNVPQVGKVALHVVVPVQVGAPGQVVPSAPHVGPLAQVAVPVHVLYPGQVAQSLHVSVPVQVAVPGQETEF